MPGEWRAAGQWGCYRCNKTEQRVILINDYYYCGDCFIEAFVDDEITGEQECDEWSCSNTASKCEDHSTPGCNDCGDSDETLYCYSCAQSNWDMHSIEDCEPPECNECYRTAEFMRCSDHYPSEECTECGNTYEHVLCDECLSERIASHHDMTVAAQSVTTSDGITFQTDDGIVINFGG